MFRLSIATLLVAVSCVFADAEVPASPPKDVPPVIGTAVAIASSAEGDDDKWSIKLVVPKVAWEVIGEERPKLEWPKFNVTVEEVKGFGVIKPKLDELRKGESVFICGRRPFDEAPAAAAKAVTEYCEKIGLKAQ